MKKNLFKKSMSVFLAVLMIMSCWVFIPGEHNRASAADGSVNPSALTAIYNGSGDRGNSSRIVICSDGEAGNTTVGHIRFNISSFSNYIANATLTLNTGNHGGTLVNNCRVDIYPLKANLCQASTGTYLEKNIENVYGGNYNSATGVSNALNYYGISTGDRLGTVYQNAPGSHDIDVTAVVQNAKTAGLTEVCFLFIMPEIFYDGNGNNSWSDTHINVSGTSLSYTAGSAGSSSTSTLLNTAVNINALNSINTNVDTNMTTTSGTYHFAGSGDQASAATTDRRNQSFVNVLYSPDVTSAVGPAVVFSTVPNSDNVRIWYPETVLMYDGNKNPKMGILLEADASNNNSLAFTSAWMSANSNGLTYNSTGTSTNWKGIATNDSCFYYIMYDSSQGYCATTDGQNTSTRWATEKGQWCFFANHLVFNADMQDTEWVRTIKPTWKYRGGNGYDGIYDGTTNKNIYVMNIKGYRTLVNNIDRKRTEILRDAHIYSVESVKAFVDAAKVITDTLAPKNFVSTSSHNVTSWNSQMITAYNNYQNAVNGLTKRTFDIAYENLFSLSDWLNSNSVNLTDNNGTNQGSASSDVENGNLTIKNNRSSGEVYTTVDYGGNINALNYIIKVEQNETYRVRFSPEGASDAEMLLLFYNDSSDWIGTCSANSGNNYTATFTAPAGATKMQVRFDVNTPGATTTFKDIAIYKQSREDKYGISVWKTRPYNNSVAYNTQIGSLDIPVREGGIFEGWYYDEAYTQPVSTTDVITGSKTVYAKWSLKNYTITYDANGGTVNGDSSLNFTVETPLEFPTASRDGHTFVGWMIQTTEGTLSAYNGGIVSANVVYGAGWTGNATFVAQWEQNTFTVTFIKADGSESTQTVAYGATPEVPSNTATAKDANGHTVYTWPAIADVTENVTYKEISTTSEHDWSEWTTKTNSTCTVAGTKERSCNVCGYVETGSLELASHTPGAAVRENEVAASCKAEGSYDEVIKCSVCGHEISRTAKTIEKLAHTEVTIPAVESTCTATGLTAGKKCSVCGTITVAQQTTDKKAHSMGDWTETTAPTCTAEGQNTRTCANCDYTETEAVEATGHSYTSTVTAPTCTEKGYTTHTCSKCGNTYTDTETAATGHSYGKWASYDATTHRRTCNNCTDYESGAHAFTKDVKPKSGEFHDYACEICEARGAKLNGVDTKGSGEACTFEKTTDYKAPTCLEYGYQVYGCSACTNAKTEKLTATNHKWAAATYTWSQTDGVWSCTATRVCENDDTHVQTADSVEVTFEEAQAATCTEMGTTTYTATFESGVNWVTTQTQTLQDIPANGHTAGAAATCTTAQICTVCDTVLVAALGHKFGETVTANDATCTTAGNYAYKQCTVCNYYFAATETTSSLETRGDNSAFVIPALGHEFTKETVAENYLKSEADCLNAAEYYKSCSRCGTSSKGQTGEATFTSGNALDHAWSTSYTSNGDGKDDTHYQTCTRENCDAKNTAVKHTWGEGVENPEADCENTGTMTYTCTATDCGATYTETVSADGHTLGDWVDEVPAICNKTGTLGHYECTVCNKYFAEDKTTVIADLTIEIAPENHNWIKGDTVAPTCTAQGYTNYKCSYCGETKKGDYVDSTGHTEATPVVENNVAPTCTATGSYDTVVYCSVCKSELSRVKTTVDALGHSWGEWETVTEATCLAEGENSRSCSVCNTVETKATEKLEHLYTGEYKWDNASSPKTHSQKCVNGCNEYGNKTECTFNTVTVDPTCDVNGYTTYTCSVCSNSYTSDYTTRDHSYVYEKGNGTNHKVTCEYADCDYETTEKCAGGVATCTDKAICDKCRTAWGENLGHSFTSYISDNNATCLGNGTKTAKCDRCDATDTREDVDSALGHKDADKDHKCDNGCDVYQGEHVDTDKNHACDYGCKETIGACEDADKDHDCDYGCNKTYGEHVDADKNHKCDYGCTETIGTCADSAEDKDHVCDYGCGKVLEECVDSDKDHACDNGCDVVFGTHADSATDDNHVCDYGCGEVLEDCKDKENDRDHKCDVCGKDEITDHEYGDADCEKPATCTECGAETGTALGHSFTNYVSNKDATCLENGTETAKCDRCDVTDTREDDESALGHSFTNYVSNNDATCLGNGTETAKCDRCDATDTREDVDSALGHKDENKDHKCDNGCDVYQGEHVDTDKNHICDYGCSVAIGACEDADKDHDCDYGCDAVFGTCEDTDFDHKCDYGCDAVFGIHADSATDDNHVCDYGCGEVLEECKDKENDRDHKCDVCGKDEITDHEYGEADCEKPATCTECGAETGTALGHSFTNYVSDGNATCLGNGTETAKCDRCDATDTREDVDSALGHKDDNNDHKCDNGCDVYQGEHVDTDKNHICDYGCSVAIGACEDADKDHDCDYGCNKTYGEHKDSPDDKDHVCDYCKSDDVLENCTDGDDKNHNCDICDKENVSAHEWVDADCTTPKTCSVCGSTDGAALNHNFAEAFTVDKKATCDEVGSKSKHCLRCTETTEVTEIPVRGHNLVDTETEKEATCLEDGVMNQKCNNGETDEYEACEHTATRVIPAKGHAFGDTTPYKAPTCSEVGNEAYKQCEICSKFFAADADKTSTEAKDSAGAFAIAIVSDAHSWDEGVVTTNPTCTEKGVKTYTCKHNSSHTRTEDVAALDHKDENKDGYCDECEEITCKHVETVVVNANPANCEYDGYSGDTVCVQCGKEISKGEIIPKTNHSWGGTPIEIIPATCSDAKTLVYKCRYCQKTENRYEGNPDKEAHTIIVLETIEPTCEKVGYIYYICTLCSTSTEFKVIEAKGHIDEDGDGVCDASECLKSLKPGVPDGCSCICHSKGFFMQLIYKIVRFFWKLFKISPSCKCGAVHY